MNILRLFFLFTILTIFMSCTSNLKVDKMKSIIEPSSNSGRFLSTRYLLKKGNSQIASEIISESKNLNLDLTLAELNFKTYLINGNFEKANEFKLIAPSRLQRLPMYNLPNFIINLKKDKFFNPNDFNFMKDNLPGFKIIFEKLNYIKLVENNNYENIFIDLEKLNVFHLLIFENTKLETQIYSNMKNTNLSLIEEILYLSYLKRKYPKTFKEEVYKFSLKFNYDIKSLELYFKNEKNHKIQKNHKFIFANLFSHLSFILSSQKNIPNSYLKILYEISHYLEPTLGNSNYFLADLYTNEKNYEIALNKLSRIKQNSFLFLYSQIKKYKILNVINKKKSNLLLDSIKEQFPKNRELLFLMANKYRDQNECPKAIKIYDELIKRSTNNNNYNYLKAICLEKLDKWKDSKKLLTELISTNPNDAYVLNYLSYSMAIRNEDLHLAKKFILKALKIENNNGYFLDTLGWIQFKQNDIDEAIKTIQMAIELEPNNSEIIDHLGDIYYKIGRKKEAIYEWNKALLGNANYELKKSIKSKLKKYNK